MSLQIDEPKPKQVDVKAKLTAMAEKKRAGLKAR